MPETTDTLDTVIQVRNLRVDAGLKSILSSFDLDVARGSVTGLLGENGAGKTTTLRALLGLVPRRSGSVRVLGLDPERHDYEIKQRVGYVPDEHGFPTWMSIRRLVNFVAGFYDRFSVEDVLGEAEQLRLQPGQRVGSLSKGEVAKLAMILALGHSPELLLLDEPTSGLDPRVRQEMLRMLVDRAQRTGMSVLFSSHILSDIAQVADRVAVVSRGRVVWSGALDHFRGSLVRVSLAFDGEAPQGVEVRGSTRVVCRGREIEAIVPSSLDAEGLAQELGAKAFRVDSLSLDELFVETVSRRDFGGRPK